MANSRKKKVLMIVPSFMRGGMENMLVSIANILAEVHDVTIYNLGSHDEGMVSQLDLRIHYHAQWMPCGNLLKALLHRKPAHSYRMLPLSQWYKMHSSRYIHRRIVQEQFDTEIAFFVIVVLTGFQNQTFHIKIDFLSNITI